MSAPHSIGNIDIHELTDQWGPFAWSFADAIPDGVSIVGAQAATWLVRPGQPDAESTSDLVDDVQVVDDHTVHVRFQYPGDQWIGRHKLRFKLTLSSGASATFAHHWIVVSRIAE